MKNIKKNAINRLFAILLSIIMALGTSPLEVFADAFANHESGNLEVVGFEPLDPDIAHQTVPFGTELWELNLPATLTGMVRIPTVQIPGNNGTDENGNTERLPQPKTKPKLPYLAA